MDNCLASVCINLSGVIFCFVVNAEQELENQNFLLKSMSGKESSDKVPLTGDLDLVKGCLKFFSSFSQNVYFCNEEIIGKDKEEKKKSSFVYSPTWKKTKEN